MKCGKPWKRGDIHLAAGHHVTMSVDANRIVHASQSENGGIDGQTGDQTGKEICVRSYYDLPYENTVHYRYAGKTTNHRTLWKAQSKQNPHVVLTGKLQERIIPMIAIICVLAQE